MEDDAIEVRKLWNLRVFYSDSKGRSTKDTLYSTREKALNALVRKVRSELIFNWEDAFADKRVLLSKEFHNNFVTDKSFTADFVKNLNRAYNFKSMKNSFEISRDTGVVDEGKRELFVIKEVELKIY